MSKLSFVIIEDDSLIADLHRTLLERAGHTVHVTLDATDGVDFITQVKPDIAVIDIMMPGMDGLEICRRLRQIPDLKNLKIIVVTSKSYTTDHDRAISMGADGVLLKPVDPLTFVNDVLAFAADDMDITYWGVRGTMPVPGPHSLRYGGNTTCVTLEMPRDQFFIFDAGSGIRRLSSHIMATRNGKLSSKVLITHPHWDHINALPFFVPLYIPGNEFEVMGPAQGATTMRELVSAQMDGTYFPITLRDLSARVFFRNLVEETLEFDGVQVSTMLLSHPGNCLGYRITMRGKVFCFVTDNELYMENAPGFQQSYVDKLVEFVGGADVLLTDATYTDEVYKSRVNWGHSCVSKVVELAHTAGVKELQLMHHDPEQTDDDIDRKLDDARSALAKLGSSVVCTAPAEGDRKRLSSGGKLTSLEPISH